MTPNQIDTSTVGVKEILIEVLVAEEVIYSQTYTFEVLDTISSRKPVINGLRDFTYIIGEQTDITEFYLKEGVTVEDTYYGDITGNLVIDHNIDLSKSRYLSSCL